MIILVNPSFVDTSPTEYWIEYQRVYVAGALSKTLVVLKMHNDNEKKHDWIVEIHMMMIPKSP